MTVQDLTNTGHVKMFCSLAHVDENVLAAYSEINTEDLHLQMQLFRRKHTV
jgi:hypothetical protein